MLTDYAPSKLFHRLILVNVNTGCPSSYVSFTMIFQDPWVFPESWGKKKHSWMVRNGKSDGNPIENLDDLGLQTSEIQNKTKPAAS